MEKSIGSRIKVTETGKREILKMIENLSSKIDYLSEQTPSTVDLDTKDTNKKCSKA